MNVNFSAPPPKPSQIDTLTDHIDEMSYRLLVDSVKDYAIFMLNPSGYIMSWNKGAERIKGYTREEIVGQHFSVFYPQDDIDSGKPDIELAVAALEGRYEEQGWRLRKDGSRFWASVTITVLHDEQGDIAGYAKVTRDLTAQREATEALRSAKEELEQRVRERTEQLEREIEERKISEQRLRDFSRYLQSVREKERVRIARDIHDDLGGILTALKIEASFYMEANADSPDVRSGKAAYRMSLVDSAIEAFRRIIDGLHPSVLDNLGLWAALEWSIEQFQQATRIDTHFRRVGPEVEFDAPRAGMIYRLLQEVMTNVARHARATRLDLLAKITRQHLVLRVTDNGVGIPDEKLNNPASYGLQGMRERVKQLGGAIKISNADGAGARVDIKIPLERRALRRPAIRADASPAS